VHANLIMSSITCSNLILLLHATSISTFTIHSRAPLAINLNSYVLFFSAPPFAFESDDSEHVNLLMWRERISPINFFITRNVGASNAF